MYVDQPGSDADGKSMAALGAQAAAKDRAAAEEGDLKVDAEAMAEQVKELQEMQHEKITELKKLAQSLTDVDGLGDEPVSQGYLQAVHASGQSYSEFVTGLDQYLESYIEGMKDAVREFAKAEEDAAAEVPDVES